MQFSEFDFIVQKNSIENFKAVQVLTLNIGVQCYWLPWYTSNGRFSSEHMILTFVDKIKKQKIRKTKNSAISNNNLGAKTFQTIKCRRCINVDRMHPSCRIE